MREWFPASELVALPGMPSTDRGVRVRAKRNAWQARKRRASGGGREFHISSLPIETQAALIARHVDGIAAWFQILRLVVRAISAFLVGRRDARSARREVRNGT